MWRLLGTKNSRDDVNNPNIIKYVLIELDRMT